MKIDKQPKENKRVLGRSSLSITARFFLRCWGEDEEYQRLKKAKRAVEKARQSFISKEAWKQYLALDEICNELECARYKAMYPTGAADYEKYPNDLDAAFGRHFCCKGGDDAGGNTADCIAQKQGHDRCGLPEKSHGLYRKPGQD